MVERGTETWTIEPVHFIDDLNRTETSVSVYMTSISVNGRAVVLSCRNANWGLFSLKKMG